MHDSLPGAASPAKRLAFAAWQCFARAFILLGLPLLAWGIFDLAAFAANPARLALAILALGQALAHGVLIYLDPQLYPAEHYSGSTLHALLFELILILAAFGDRRSVLTWNENQPARWLGLGVILLGALLFIWANAIWVRHLRAGAAPGSLSQLRTGPYRFIRQPAMLYMLLIALGSALTLRSWPGLALTPLLYLTLRRRYP